MNPTPSPITRASRPLGAILRPDGVDFAIHSRHATHLTLVVWPRLDEAPREIVLLAESHREGDQWRVHVPGLGAGAEYAWRAHSTATGPSHAFDGSHLLLDPYSVAVAGGERWGERTAGGRPYRSVVVDVAALPAFQAPRPRRSLADSVIYEVHVRHFTKDASSGVAHPGTYRGMTERIPYLRDLGVTAVQLMPVAEFDETDNPNIDPRTGRTLLNVWGYHPLAFLAPKVGFAHDATALGALLEFRAMVDAFHAAGIEVILDVVFNHTGEGSARERARSWRGLDRASYYLLDGRGRDLDFTGCGNTFACGREPGATLIVDALRHWVTVGGVDGFRFDLASVLARDADGAPSPHPALLERIARDAGLQDVHLIAEPWDAAGLYHVGSFPHFGRWAELNGRFRDDVRRFLKGAPGQLGALATRLAGSSDLYAHDRTPGHSVNFLTSHDGYTLHDLVSFQQKHNLANGEDNRDGSNQNDSWNSGHEGPSDDPWILARRSTRKRDFAALLLLAQGSVLWLYGDEVSRTQHGNNNPWCQDAPEYWFDWTRLDSHGGLHRFVRGLLHLRQRFPEFRRREFFDPHTHGPGSVNWQSEEGGPPDWGELSRRLVMHLPGEHDGPDFLLLVNGDGALADFTLPALPADRSWHRVVDTALPSPHDFTEPEQAPPVHDAKGYPMHAQSVALLMAHGPAPISPGVPASVGRARP
ncbi:MAG: isoamylase [Candidatus Eisenbacteria bacterium]